MLTCIKRILIFCCVICFYQDIALCQSENNFPQIVPPSPTASELGKYGDIPVSLYTGSPNISIPIYTIEGRDMSIPINLSYHPSGIKVDEVASWVGLGWSLNAGGVVSRSVKGIPDEWDNGYRGSNGIGQKVQDYILSNMTTNERFTFEKNVADGIWDAEPDVYYFNFNGYSGKLVYDHDGTFGLIPYQNLKIEGHGINNQGFTITTPDGIKYIFQDEEMTSTESDCGEAPIDDALTAWYLSEIVSPNNEHAYFTYTNELISYDMNIGETKRNLLSTSATNGCSNVDEFCTTIFSSDAKRLTRIEINDSRVDFTVPQNDRLDLPYSYQLDKVKVYNYTDFVNPVHVFKLYHSYFTTSNERLKLDSLVQYSGDESESLPGFEFEYNTNVPGGIPPRLSKKQDHWGYFNNNPENTLIPDLTNGITGINTAGIDLSGANRDADEDMVLACSLSRIKYPTRGYTDFEFERHDAGYYKSTFPIDNYEMESNSLESEVVTAGTDSNPFTIDFTQTIPITVEIDQFPSSEVDLYVAIEDVNNNSIFYIEPWDMGQQVWMTNLSLTPGDYQLIAYSGEGPPNSRGCSISIDYDSYRKVNGNPIINKYEIVGGLRIKKMTHHDGISAANDQITRYEYRMSDELDRSSGVLLSRPIYYFAFTDIVQPEDPGQGGLPSTTCQYLMRSSSSKTLLGSTQGSHVGYREVTVYQGDENGPGNGKTINSFISPFEINDQGTWENFPFPPAISRDHRRGKPKSIVQYKQNPSSHKVAETLNSYYLEPTSNKKIITGIKISYSQNSFIENQANLQFGVGEYDYISEWEYPSQQIQKTYDQNDQNSLVETITNFTYGNPSHIQMTESSTTNSDGEVITEKYFYPEDYSGVSGQHPVAELQSRFMHSYLIETLRERNGLVLEGTRNEYQEEHGNIILRKVYEIETLLPFSYNPPLDASGTGGNYFLRQEFSDYSPEGRILEFKQPDGTSSSFLWDDEKIRPIAQVLNASSTEIAFTSFEGEIANGKINGWNLNGNIASGGYSGSKYLPIGSSISITLSSIGTPYILAYWNGVSFVKQEIVGNSVTVNGPADEVRVYPKNAQMKTFTYDQNLRIGTETDYNGRAVFYQYDGFARLTKILDHKGNLRSLTEYNFGN